MSETDSGESNRTTDCDAIRERVEERGGQPPHVEENDLAMVYRDETTRGEENHFANLVSRDE